MYNKNMIALARDLRGYTQSKLSEEVGSLSQMELSHLENGRSPFMQEEAEKIAKALKLPTTFFEKQDPIVKRVSKFYYRKRVTLAAKQQASLEAKIKILRSTITELLKEVELDFKGLPKWSVNKNQSPSDIAIKARIHFNLDDGPIENPVSILEQQGIPVVFLNVDCVKFSGMTVQTDTSMPIIVLNKNMPNDHKRFTLAHELGHLIMHIPFTDDPEFMSSLEDIDRVEEEANQFASEFLMPAARIAPQMRNNFTYSKLTELKLYWKVSKQSLIFRAHQLGLITKTKYQTLFIELSRNGERRNELLDVPIDEPQILKAVFDVWSSELGSSLSKISEVIAGVPLQEFQEWLGMTPSPVLRVVR